MGLEGIARVIAATVTLTAGVALFQAPAFGSDQSRAKDLLQQTCVQCHRLDGTADSRFNLRAPDLIWAGSKYQRSWLISWLTGKEAPIYIKGYRWDLADVPSKHPMVTESEASEIADYFVQHNKDPRVTVGAFDLSKVTKFDVTFGGMVYKVHVCLGCHTIEENGKIIGGPQSVCIAECRPAIQHGLAVSFWSESPGLRTAQR